MASDQDTSIEQFRGITGADEDRARSLLEACGWDMELAINMYVDTDEVRPAIVDEVRPPIPPVRQVLVQDSPSDIPTVRRGTIRRNPDVYDAFGDFQAEAQWQEMAIRQEQNEDRPVMAMNSNHGATLQDLFRPPLELMFRGPFDRAREAGTDKNKWILVNIQNGKEFSCQALNRDVWSNQTVKDIVKENFIFWQVYHDSFEGSRYTQFYAVKSYPHVSIIDPRTGEQMRSWPNSIDRNSFCDTVVDFLSDHPSPDIVIEDEVSQKTPEKNEQDSEVEIMDQDDDDDDDNDNDEDVKEVEVEEQQLQTKLKEEPENYRTYLGRAEIEAELVVRFPNGDREHIKFPQDTQIKALFLFLKSRGYPPEEHSYVTTFPKRDLHDLPPNITLDEAKLTRDTIFVEKKGK